MSFQSLQTSTEHSLLQVRCSFSSRWVATNMFALVTPTSKGRLKKSPNERYYKLKQYLSYGPQSSFKPTRIFGGFGSCRSNDDFYIKKSMLVLGPHDKTGRQIWIKQGNPTHNQSHLIKLCSKFIWTHNTTYSTVSLQYWGISTLWGFVTNKGQALLRLVHGWISTSSWNGVM